MSITLSPSKASYLTRVAAGLADLAAEDREEVVQDLEAHLAEIGDDEVESTLGTPEAFVDEFRHSAGLTTSEAVAIPSIVERARSRLAEWSTRLSELTHWQSFRPVWLWTRGWLLVSAWSVLYDVEGFRRFPIPTIGGSSMAGLILVVGATVLSLWLDAGPREGVRAFGSVVISVAATWALVGMLLNPLPSYSEIHLDETYIDRLTNADGSWVENIYAYTLEGEQVEVLLFDHSGRPLLSLPTHVYEEGEFAPGAEIHYDNGAVSFTQDQFGRVISNLYPLQLSTYDEMGRLAPMPPPPFGIPTIETDGTPDDDDPVPTTIFGR